MLATFLGLRPPKRPARRLQDGSKASETPPRRRQGASKAPPRRLQEGPKTFLGALSGPKKPPRRPQDAFKSVQERPKTLSQAHLRRFYDDYYDCDCDYDYDCMAMLIFMMLLPFVARWGGGYDAG